MKWTVLTTVVVATTFSCGRQQQSSYVAADTGRAEAAENIVEALPEDARLTKSSIDFVVKTPICSLKNSFFVKTKANGEKIELTLIRKQKDVCEILQPPTLVIKFTYAELNIVDSSNLVIMNPVLESLVPTNSYECTLSKGSSKIDFPEKEETSVSITWKLNPENKIKCEKFGETHLSGTLAIYDKGGLTGGLIFDAKEFSGCGSKTSLPLDADAGYSFKTNITGATLTAPSGKYDLGCNFY